MAICFAIFPYGINGYSVRFLFLPTFCRPTCVAPRCFFRTSQGEMIVLTNPFTRPSYGGIFFVPSTVCLGEYLKWQVLEVPLEWWTIVRKRSGVSKRIWNYSTNLYTASEVGWEHPHGASLCVFSVAIVECCEGVNSTCPGSGAGFGMCSKANSDSSCKAFWHRHVCAAIKFSTCSEHWVSNKFLRYSSV